MKNRKQRRAEARKINTPQKVEKIVNAEIYLAKKEAREQAIEQAMRVYIVMTAYTLNYKLHLGQKRLPEIMNSILQNIDSFRTGQLNSDDFSQIEGLVKELGIEFY